MVVVSGGTEEERATAQKKDTNWDSYLLARQGMGWYGMQKELLELPGGGLTIRFIVSGINK